MTLVWPKGYTVKGDSKSFEVLDASKNVVARSGSPLAIGGGSAGPFQDTWTERDCIPAGPGRIALVCASGGAAGIVQIKRVHQYEAAH